MKAITIWQPWASLIVAGAKPYEFRGWKPPRSLIGQRIAIHAGARSIKRNEMYWLNRQFWDETETPPCLHAHVAQPLLLKWIDNPRLLPLSHILCTAILGEPKGGGECAREFGIEVGGNDSDRDGTFNWGWPLTEIQVLEPPEPARGAQGFWDWKAGH